MTYKLDSEDIRGYNYDMDKRETLRRLWISERQDRYHATTEKDMEFIISQIDECINALTDEQVEELL